MKIFLSISFLVALFIFILIIVVSKLAKISGKSALENVNAQDIDGWTALIRASANGDLEVVQELIKAGADVNTKNNNGQTALMIASANGHLEIANALKEAGAVE